MKKIAKVIICFLLITGLVYTPVMIPQLSNTPAVAVADAATVQLNKTDLKLYTQGTFKLKVTGTTKTVKWSSANSNIATVNENGFVTAKKIGQTKIKAKVGLKTYTCNVKVCYAPKMNWTAASVYAGGKTTLKVKNAIGPIKWTSSKPGVATVSSNGVVTGKVAGTTIITAKVKNKTTTCKITVKKRMTVNKTSVNFNKLSGSATVKVTFVAPGNWTITYNVQNTNVATCKWGQGWDGNTCNLYIYPEGEGTTYVNLTNSYNRQVVKIKVTVDLPDPEEQLKITLKNRLPATFIDYNYSGKIDQMYTLKEFVYDVTYYEYSNDYTIQLKFTGTKDYDREGNGYSRSVPIGWKLYDADGYVIDSGTSYSSAICVNESFRNANDYVFDLQAGNYVLEIFDTE